MSRKEFVLDSVGLSLHHAVITEPGSGSAVPPSGPTSVVKLMEGENARSRKV
jgi:hypothetical protein